MLAASSVSCLDDNRRRFRPHRGAAGTGPLCCLTLAFMVGLLGGPGLAEPGSARGSAPSLAKPAASPAHAYGRNQVPARRDSGLPALAGPSRSAAGLPISGTNEAGSAALRARFGAAGPAHMADHGSMLRAASPPDAAGRLVPARAPFGAPRGLGAPGPRYNASGPINAATRPGHLSGTGFAGPGSRLGYVGGPPAKGPGLSGNAFHPKK